MNTPVCFVRENVEKLLETLKKGYWMKNWKLALFNTYRFSEYYTYGIFTDKMLNMKNHFYIDYHVFPQINISNCTSADDFKNKIKNQLKDDKSIWLWLQKKNRKLLEGKYLDFNIVSDVIKNYWEGNI